MLAHRDGTWLSDLTTDETAAAQVARIRREVEDFGGLIDTWDVINEVVIMPVFDRYDNGITRLARELGRVGIVRLVFDAARAANPAATFLINDFDLSADYERLIEDCLAAGVTIDAIGMQSHMHQGYWGEERTLELLERYARFGLPLHWTESTLVSGELMPPEIVDLNDHQVDDWPTTPDGEARQADEVERHYRRSSATRQSPPSRGGACRTAAGSTHPVAWCGSMAPSSLRTRPSTD